MPDKIEIGSKEWIERRRNFICASDAPIILGHSPWKTPDQLMEEKLKGVFSPTNAQMQRGVDLEPEARRLFVEITGHFVLPEWRVHDSIPWMAATFDGIDDEGVIVEIKCPGKKDHECAKQGKVPEKYIAQLQHQMYVAGVGQCYYLSYKPEDVIRCHMIRVTADRDFQREMLDTENLFWQELQRKRST